MSMVNKFASQPISDALIDELADLLYEAAIRSCTPRKDIRRIVGDFLEDYRDADQVLCSVCKEVNDLRSETGGLHLDSTATLHTL